jgi:hypothetical protein
VGQDAFTPDVCVVRPGGSVFDAYFADAQIDVLGILKFVLEEGACNETHDGSEATATGEQQRRISFGCCDQAYTKESEKGHKIPKATYGTGIFDKIEGPKKQNDIVGLIAVIQDCMQDAYDFIEVDKLKNPYPCNDTRHLERFANIFQNAIEAQRSR